MFKLFEDAFNHRIGSLPIEAQWGLLTAAGLGVMLVGLAKWMGYSEVKKLWTKRGESQDNRSMNIIIDSPSTGSDSPQRATIRGRAPVGCDVWVVVHPMKYDSYWIQPRVSVNADGTWAVSAYIGEPGSAIGGRYELRAFGNPKQPMDDKNPLAFWPAAEFQSDIVELIRT